LRAAIVSDLHSNVEAFNAALDHIAGLNVDKIYCLGDIVGYGPDPIDMINMVKTRVDACILGNHDEAILKEPKYFNRIPYEAIMWTKVQLSFGCEDSLDFLKNLPEILHIEGMVLTHGLLDNNMCYVDNTDDLMVIFEGMEENDFICFGGHSHFPSVWALEGEQIYPIEILPGEQVSIGENIDKMWVNVGSVGQPRDGDNRLSYMIWDTELKSIEYHRVEYPFKKTMSKIRKVPELDNYLSERLEKGI
jgi:predicted phosphodiesterase